MSLGGSKKKQTERVQIDPQLDPVARSALQQVVGSTQQFRPGPQGLPAVRQTDPATIQGAQRLQDRPQSAFIQPGEEALTGLLSGRFLTPGALGEGLNQIGQTTGGQFFGQDPGATGTNQGLGNVRDRIISSAQQAVGDQFSQAGRTGSPAQAQTLGKTVARELAPFEFGALESQLGRQQAAFQNERQRQLAAAELGLNQFNTGVQQQLGGLQLAPQFEPLQDSVARRLLQTGDIVGQENQLRIDEPFLQFERFANPLLAAAGRFPVSTTRTGRASSTQFGGGFSL